MSELPLLVLAPWFPWAVSVALLCIALHAALRHIGRTRAELRRRQRGHASAGAE